MIQKYQILLIIDAAAVQSIQGSQEGDFIDQNKKVLYVPLYLCQGEFKTPNLQYNKIPKTYDCSCDSCSNLGKCYYGTRVVVIQNNKIIKEEDMPLTEEVKVVLRAVEENRKNRK